MDNTRPIASNLSTIDLPHELVREVPTSPLQEWEWADLAARPSIGRLDSEVLPKPRLGLTHPAILLFFAVHGLLALVFFFAPGLDLEFSNFFYKPGLGFDIASRSSARALPFIPWFTTAFIIGSGWLLIRNIADSLRRRQAILRSGSTRRILFLLLTLGFGPGLLINTILKVQSGRARPIRVQAFGGDREFTPAFSVANQCRGNCSFVSGDAAMGYFLLAFLFIARKRRLAIALSAYAAGSAIGLVRIAQGAHFLSDVIFAGFFTFLVAWVLYLLILRSTEDSSPVLVPRYTPGRRR